MDLFSLFFIYYNIIYLSIYQFKKLRRELNLRNIAEIKRLKF